MTAGSAPDVEIHITDEANLTSRRVEDFRVEPLVSEGDAVAQGAPILQSRRHPDIRVVAPMPGRVASIDLGPGHRLSAIRLFLESAAGRHEYDVSGAADDSERLRILLQRSGLWRAIRSRPFGRPPAVTEEPAAIFVMALDTRPLAADPRIAIKDSRADFERGLHALFLLTGGPVVLCQNRDDELVGPRAFPDRLRLVKSDDIHPWGLAGFQVHREFPAAVDRPVWDLHAEDVAAIGELLKTGLLRETRLVSVGGSAMTRARLVRCQPGADLRALCYGLVRPGPHVILSGSPLDGREARWLGRRERQVSVMTPPPRGSEGHWFLSALQRASRPLPLIPNAAVEQAVGDAMPVMPFLRALASGDGETAVKLGALSLLEEDLALADYVTCAEPRLAGLLRGMLDRIAAEEAQ